MLRRKDVNILRKQLLNIIVTSSLITVLSNMVEKAIGLSLFRQAKGKQLLSNIPDDGMLDHLQTRPWVCPQDDLHEKMFFSLLGLLVGLAEASWWRLPFSQLWNPLAGTFFLFHQLSPFSPSMDNLEPFWVSVLPPYSPKLPWKLSGWTFFF